MKKLVSIIFILMIIIVMTNSVFACTVNHRVYCHYYAYISSCNNDSTDYWSYDHYWPYDNDRYDDDRDDDDIDTIERPEFSDLGSSSWLQRIFSWFRW